MAAVRSEESWVIITPTGLNTGPSNCHGAHSLEPIATAAEYIMESADYTTASVWVTTAFIGFHQWPDAPDEVAYLRDLHRHLFKVKVTISVRHDDREIEFHMLKEKLDGFIKDRLHGRLGWNLQPATSCEMMARDIFVWLDETYNNRGYIEVDVSEDGENGATIEG